MAEIWKSIPIEGLENYVVSNLGNIRNNKHNTDLRPHSNRGYLKIGLKNNKKSKNYLVHRLVMYAFEGIKPLEVNHINNVRSDNRLENLEYVTSTQNNNRQKRNKYRRLKIIELFHSQSWNSAESFFKEIMLKIY